MICAWCEKSLKGGFEQPDKTFLCAKCVIWKVEKESRDKQIKILLGAIAYIHQECSPNRRGYWPRGSSERAGVKAPEALAQLGWPSERPLEHDHSEAGVKYNNCDACIAGINKP